MDTNKLTIKNVKEYVFSSAGEFLIGYKLSKSRGSFKKKIDQNSIEVAFGFLDYYPLNYQYHFAIIIWIKEIEIILDRFYSQSGVDATANWAVAVFEGDFIDDLKESEFKWRKNYYNIVDSFESLDQKFIQTSSLLRDKALPFSYSICNLESFQNYYLNNRYVIVKNLANTILFTSVLLSAYLKSKKNYYELSTFLKDELDKQLEKGNNFKELYDYLEKLNKFVEVN